MVHPQDRKFQILRAVQVGDVTLSEESYGRTKL